MDGDRSIFARMSETLEYVRNCDGRSWRTAVRTPKAFYLNETDWVEFEATKPPQISSTFRDEPTMEPGFDGVPVRQAKGAQRFKASKLYSMAGTSKSVLLT